MINRSMRQAATLVVLAAVAARAQQLSAGQLVADTIHAKSIEKNLFGDSPDRSMLVYLPQSYASSPNRRYPVIYLLHGYGGDERGWTGYAPVKPAMDTLVRAGIVREMIIVMPNANNALGGSFYTNSVATGNWDDFIANELVAFIDKKYRTMARPESRGLAGHSMGGYGTFAVGMRHAGDVFGALYSLSGCCTHVSAGPGSNTTWSAVTGAQSVADARRLAFIPRVSLALSAAFSPNANAPPLFYNPPYVRNGEKWESVDSVYKHWVEHAPFNMIASHADQLKRLRGFAFDVGLSDQLVSPRALASLDTALTKAGVRHTYETYDGDHTNRIPARLAARLLPFFSQTLDFGDASRR
jgi:enterochelin esterase-like enzyme